MAHSPTSKTLSTTMNSLIPLSQWLVKQPQLTVAVDMGIEYSSNDLLEKISEWVGALEYKPGTCWAVYHPDAFEFLAILLALWQLGKCACIPGDNNAGTIKLLNQHVDGFIGDFNNSLTIDKAKVTKVLWQKLKPEALAVEIYTSGSSGEPKAIRKTISQLEQELATIESHWPTFAGAVLTTVSHKHFYGFIFRLLWPFSAGNPFARFASEYSEDIFHQAQHYPVFSVISSPSHLSRINTAVPWGEINNRCSHLISSAAPLQRDDSLFINKLFDAPVREIYGSSETGVIASRIQHGSAQQAKWYPLPNVKVSVESDGDILSVYSPFLGQKEALLLSDRVTFDKFGGFELIGRVDTLVKIEGKRVSLTAMESLLSDNNWVAQVKALVLNRTRVESAIVIRLTGVGEDQLMLMGRRMFIKQLSACLVEHFDATVLPRRWRFVNFMPYNAQAKLPLKALQILFEKPPIIEWPRISQLNATPFSAQIQCHIPSQLIYFDGHFDEHPVLPGVTQLHWVEKLGRQLFSIKAKFKNLEVIKFKQIIRPEMAVTLQLDYDRGAKKLKFNYLTDTDGIYASGRVCFE